MKRRLRAHRQRRRRQHAAGPADLRQRRRGFAAPDAAAGGAAAYEVWNEEDETDFWGAAVDAARYAAILKAAYPAIKQADPSAKVLLGPLTGNNYNFLGPGLRRRRRRSFDAAGVHTDTACLVDPPSSFYREVATSRASPSWASAPSTT